MQTEVESAYAPGVEEKPRWAAEPLTLDDLKLLAELFYLPYEHGPTARTMLQELHWLKAHSPEEVGLPFRRGLRQQVRAPSRLLFPGGRVALQSAALRPDVRGGGADVQPPVQRAQPQRGLRPLQLRVRHQEWGLSGPGLREDARWERAPGRSSNVPGFC